MSTSQICPKIFAKIFFDGVSAVNSGSGRQYIDGLEYLEILGNGLEYLETLGCSQFYQEVITEYRKLMAEYE